MKNTLFLAGVAMFALGGTAIAQGAVPQSDPTAPASAAQPDSTMPPGGVTVPGADPAAASSPTAQQPTEATTAPSGSTSDAGMASTTGATSAPADPNAAAMTSAPAGDPAKMAAAQQTVDSGWAKYDPDNKGSLTPLAFGKWVMAAQGQDVSAMVDKSRTARTANLPAVKVLNATAAEFSRADTNKDRMISREELTAYLSA